MIEVNNLTKFRVNKKYLVAVAKKVLTGENKKTEHVSVALVSPQEIHALNKQYRGKDKPTDVLSFGKVSDFKEEILEVIICPEVTREYLRDSGLSTKKQLAKMLIHGLLHTLGYEHEGSEQEAAAMEKKEEHYFSKI